MRIADFETHEARHADVFAQFGDLGLHQLSYGEGGFLHERLFEQADLFVELGHAALGDLLDHLLGLALGEGARLLDFLLLLEHVVGDVFLADETRIGGRDVHRDIVHQFLEIIGARDEIALAIDFHHHAELAAVVDVGADQTLLGGARSLLAGRRDAALAQHDFALGEIALGFHQGALAFHHPRAGALAECFD